MNELKVLIVDDEPELRKSIPSILEHSLSSQPLSFFEATDGEDALRSFKNQSKDLVLMDVRMPRMSGLEALRRIKKEAPETFVVMMTAHSNLPDAVRSIKEGAYDYLEKPLQPTQLTQIVRKAIEARSLITQVTASRPIMDDDVETNLVGTSEKMKEVFDLVDRLSKVDTTVFIRGENGTGKELVARAIHHNSPRKNGEFVTLRCGSIPENLLESELFGHEKGAFEGATERKIGKFQQANNGTIFLDEMGELPLHVQDKLLQSIRQGVFSPVGSQRVLKTNTRIVTASRQNIEKKVEDGTFNEDLFFRLNAMTIFIPPLRDRIDDIQGLTRIFLKKFSVKYRRQFDKVEDEVWRLFKNHSWPGNLRELENTVERFFVVERSSTITVNSLPESLRTIPKEPLIDPTVLSGPMDFDAFKESLEKEFIVKALKANAGKVNKTVADANIPKNTLLRKIKKYGINVKDYQ